MIRLEQMRTLEAIACVLEPDAERAKVPADALAWLTPDTGEEDIYQASLQIDAQYTGKEFEVPGGQLARMRSMITIGGLVDLRAEE